MSEEDIEKLTAWAKERQQGLQYRTPYGDVYSPCREPVERRLLRKVGKYLKEI